MKFQMTKNCGILLMLLLPFAEHVAAHTGDHRRTPVVDVYQRCHRAVVNISGERVVVSSRRPGFDFPGFLDMWGSRYALRIPVLGSGFVAHREGFIITNAHVVEGTDRIKVTFSDGREYQARVINTHKNKDLAVLQIDANEPLPVIELGTSNDLLIGETVIAIGNPFGYSNTVTSGVVSAVGRDIQIDEGFWLRGLIQTDASINPGNSGGPLLNINAKLVGINTAIKADAENIGFAIPVDSLVNNIRQMLMPEQLRRVRLGLILGRKQSVGPHTGLLVEAVTQNSPADRRGIAAGDLILRLDGHSLTDVFDFYIKMMDKEIGEPIELEYVRAEGTGVTRRHTRLTLTARPIPDGVALAKRFFQMEVSELNRTLARRFSFDGPHELLVIVDVSASGQAAEIGLREGDLILSINHHTLTTLREFSLEMEKISEGDNVEFHIMRFSLGLFGNYVPRRYRTKLKAAHRGRNSLFF